jgi:DNA (cytosine-5)-methyltransferase 1
VNGCVTTTYGSKNYSNHEEVMSGSLVSGAWVPMPFDLAQITSKLNYSQARPGDPVPPLNTVSQMHVALAVKTAQTSSNGIGVAEDVAYTLDGAQGQAIAFSAKDHGGDAGPLSPTLRPGTHDASHANGGVMPALVHQNKTNNVSVLDYSPSLRSGASHNSHLALSTVVRRLTPRECERLQGLPDDWTLVPYRGKPAADAPRYKAIGNGMAVPVLRWIGQRIAMVEGEMNA